MRSLLLLLPLVLLQGLPLLWGWPRLLQSLLRLWPCSCGAPAMTAFSSRPWCCLAAVLLFKLVQGHQQALIKVIKVVVHAAVADTAAPQACVCTGLCLCYCCCCSNYWRHTRTLSQAGAGNTQHSLERQTQFESSPHQGRPRRPATVIPSASYLGPVWHIRRMAVASDND